MEIDIILTHILELPDEWYRLGNSSIKMFYQNKTWNDSRIHCQSLGGDLLSIATEYENMFVKDVFKTKGTYCLVSCRVVSCDLLL